MSKKIGYIALVVVLAVAVVLLLDGNISPNQDGTFATNSLGQLESAAEDVDKESSISNSMDSEPEIEPETSSLTLTAKIRSEQDEWNRGRGYVDSMSERRDLLLHSDSVLQSLAESGDPDAQFLLGNRKMLSNPDEALSLFRQAAIQGYTVPFSSMANINSMLAQDSELLSVDEKGPDSYHYAEAASWLMVGEARGDPSATVSLTRLLNDIPDDMEEEVLAEACAAATTKYQQLESERQDQGLGPFENSPNPVVLTPFIPGQYCEDWPFKRPQCVQEYVEGSPVYRCT